MENLLTYKAYNISDGGFNESVFTNSTTTQGPSSSTGNCEDSLGLLRLITSVYFSLPICIFGIIGNILSFIVLQKQYRKQSTTTYLQALAVADTLVLVSSVLLHSFRYIAYCYDVWHAYLDSYHYIFVIVYPCVYVFRLAGVWLTVSLTIDRWIAVCYPLSAQRRCTLSRSYKQVAAVCVSASIYSLPRFFEYRIDMESDFKFSATSLNEQNVYTILYQTTLFFLVMYVAPMVIMSVLNVSLIKALRRSLSFSAGGTQTGLTEKRESDQKAVTTVVVCVVVLFIICHILAMTSHLFYSLEKCFGVDLEIYRRYISNISNVMVDINSASNFLIYSACSISFREQFKQLFCGRNRKQTGYRWQSTSMGKTSFTMTSTQL